MRSLRARLAVAMVLMLLPLVVLGTVTLAALHRNTSSVMALLQGDMSERHTVLHLEGLIRGGASPEDVNLEFDRALAIPGTAPGHHHALLEDARRAWALALTAEPGPARERDVAQVLALLGRAHERLRAEDEIHRTAATRVWHGSLLLVAGVFVVGLGLAALTGLRLARAVLRPVRGLEQAAARFGDGALDQRAVVAGDVELAGLARAFNTMADKVQHAHEQIARLSTHDALTGLHNHGAFQLRLAEELERARRYGHPVCLLMLDLDEFKRINDLHGHLAGDAALRAVAAVMEGQVRPSDHVARYGGEEFAILLPHVGRAGGLSTAERIRAAVEAATVPAGPPVKLTISVGVAVFPEDGAAEDPLIAAADQALYAAKAAGRNRVRPAGGAPGEP